MFEVVPMFRCPPFVDPPPLPPPPPHDVATNATTTPTATSLVALRISIPLPIRPLDRPLSLRTGPRRVWAAPPPPYRPGAYPEPDVRGRPATAEVEAEFFRRSHLGEFPEPPTLDAQNDDVKREKDRRRMGYIRTLRALPATDRRTVLLAIVLLPLTRV